ncbi:Monothiol glutaredoxin-S14, chloroplastic [Tetrabaena socialis]|uniref:Monothiol glutaredoxin-S14, chloroplastic n=1 Tax=Tetrabaena socialis TaxID=47790 RepID=A0A2J7ZRR4_9CHLO|nr:Monothiol glutaredoxin-S14, chloroplastic [Tetrabaena socialis]|eukprot:PNH02964.1 Monothiol glutaredoxin-S14, chloroplastic [Tetrabaena socialis]
MATMQQNLRVSAAGPRSSVPLALSIRRQHAAPACPAPQRFVPDRRTRVRAASGGMNPELKTTIDELVNANRVVVFMKGTRQFPQCGFSNTVVQILNQMESPYETVNILADDRLRSGMKEYSQWPTFPQVYINGEFFGGCDIMIEAFKSGELKEQLEVALNA